MSRPFIVTAKLPPDIQGWAEGLRRAHFPPERNHLHAHVTMFHAFAPSLLDELRDFLPQVAREYAPPAARISGLMDLGKGTAIALEAPGLLALRAMIAEHFHGALTDQDLYEPRPHITIQNKVSKEEARALQAELAPQIEPRDFAFPALELHRYLGGPWEWVKTCAFRGKERA
ncbi:2'-5' RNA ligase family protein [Erythrobacter sp. JK5]|uniref:2'-5' RNA ligase family protein n=1 Tax=Erythrobacter sp. JK5 TaxID=2829500 RepID=UPI001BAD426C|nr:2'-5' RNA ligase family protein [Erythrobacter sp. JK5]QUL39084.1 2'-5' RNA ligase family protein [Erythrobacter sp. JK5]